MITAEVLRKKRDGHELSHSEIQALVHGLVRGDVSHAQAAAFLMACCTRGMSALETAALTQAMAHSGAVFDFSGLGAPVVDKHSTGGVGDKVSLLLAPIAAACGLLVPMISGRGLGHTGGTVDKLESIVGMELALSEGDYEQLLRRNGVFMARQTDQFVPADRILYHLRDVTGTVESVGLLTSSILSKKFAEGLDALVMDVKVGRGAFMESFGDARVLAQSLCDTGREAGLPVRVLFTAMHNPLGYSMGNWPEVEETIDALSGRAEYAVRAVTEELCAAMLLACGAASSRDLALQQVRAVWDSGEGLRRFYRMVEAQGGDIESSRRAYEHTPRVAICAPADGVLTGIHARAIGLAGIVLGVGRRQSTDDIDYSAGMVFYKTPGQEVRCGEEIGYIQGRRTQCFAEVLSMVHSAVEIGAEPLPVQPPVLGELL